MSRKLDEVEFELLSGTDFMVHVVRTFDDGHKVVLYFEDIMDRENVDQFLRQFSNEEFY